MGSPRFVCHMAVLSGALPRNSFSAIAECFEAGVERIEIDVHSLAGEDYAVYHDHRLELQTTGSGALGSATADDIRAVRFLDRPDDRPPLLSEVVSMARGCSTELQLDLKDWRPMHSGRLRALEAIIAPVRERVVVSSGQDWNLRLLRNAAPGAIFGFDPGHYLASALDAPGEPFPRGTGAYGYRDDHPLALGRTSETPAYLRERFETLLLQAPGSRELFLSYRLALQMLDDGFNAAAFLHERGIDANVWTLDCRGPEPLTALRRLLDAGYDRVTTNTARAWMTALAP